MAFRFCSCILLTLCLVHANFIFAQAESAEDFFSQKPPEYAKPSSLIGWIDNREYLSLNGQWKYIVCLLYTSPSPRDLSTSRMPSSA